MSLSYLLADDHTTMLNIIEKILCHFESCFSRKAAFRWFVIIITGLMLRSDKLGVTSIRGNGWRSAILYWTGKRKNFRRRSLRIICATETQKVGGEYQQLMEEAAKVLCG